MKFLSLHIENFGKLSGLDLAFRDGLNELCAENGYGKTTIAAFIKAMLYGLPDTRKQSLFENERSRYAPWGGGACGGTLTFTIGAKTYRAERSFGAKQSDDRFALYDLATGKPSEDYDEKTLGQQLLGIDADGFERTLFLSERNLSGKNDNQTVAEKLADLVGTTGDVGGYDGAIDRLEKRRSVLSKRGNRGEIAEKEQEIERIKRRIEDLTAIENRLEEDKKALNCLHIEEKKLENDRKALVARKKALDEQKESARVEAQRAALIAERDGAARRVQELAAPFAGDEPTAKQIDDCADKLIEANRLRAVQDPPPKADPEREAYRTLSPERLEAMTKLADEIERDERERERLAAIGEPKENRSPLLLLIAGASLFTAGLLFGALLNPYLFLLCLPGVPLFAAALVKRKEDAAAREKWRRDAQAIDERKKEREDALVAALRPYAQNIARPVQAMHEVRAKYDFYRTRSAEEPERTAAAERIRNAERCEAEAARFLARYHAGGDDPIADLREWRREIDQARMQLRTAEERLATFAREHSSLPAAPTEVLPTEEELALALRQNEDERLACAAQIAQKNEQISRSAEVPEEKKLLIIQQNDLEEEVARMKHELEINLKTQDYLEAARDNLTARYLSGTRESFLAYVRDIGDDTADFTMDTSFTVRKSDFGASRQTDAYSMGTRDLYALAARLALVDSLYKEEEPVLMLDDPFAHFDDKTLARAIAALERIAQKRQILYFTCASARSLNRR